VSQGDPGGSSVTIFEGRLAAVERALGALRYRPPESSNFESTVINVVQRGRIGSDTLLIRMFRLTPLSPPPHSRSDDLIGAPFNLTLAALEVVQISVTAPSLRRLGDADDDLNRAQPCLPCYRLDPTNADRCVHIELYYTSPKMWGRGGGRG
jgi:hypothetical protein